MRQHDRPSMLSRYTDPLDAAGEPRDGGDMLSLIVFAQLCAPFVPPGTMLEVVRVESGGQLLALNVNGLSPREQPHPKNLPEAVQAATYYIAQGRNVDVGLMQINSRNLLVLGYSLVQAFDPCSNLRGGAVILTANYLAAARKYGPGLFSLQAALSLYNTGDFEKGFANGYVGRYFPLDIPAITVRALRPREPLSQR